MLKFHDIKIKLLTATAKIPTMGSLFAAGQDLYADERVFIKPGETQLVPLGIATQIPNNMAGFVFSRSGIAIKRGLRVAHGVGVVDADYRGEWKVPLHNDSSCTQIVEQGERIAQVIFMKYKRARFMPVQQLEETDRGDGGFGSTGTK